jgi:hypothetical protein
MADRLLDHALARRGVADINLDRDAVGQSRRSLLGRLELYVGADDAIAARGEQARRRRADARTSSRDDRDRDAPSPTD